MNTYGDTFGRIDMIGGQVRIELLMFDRPEDDGGQPPLKPVGRLVMPLAGFQHAVAAMQEAATKFSSISEAEGEAQG